MSDEETKEESGLIPEKMVDFENVDEAQLKNGSSSAVLELQNPL